LILNRSPEESGRQKAEEETNPQQTTTNEWKYAASYHRVTGWFDTQPTEKQTNPCGRLETSWPGHRCSINSLIIKKMLGWRLELLRIWLANLKEFGANKKHLFQLEHITMHRPENEVHLVKKGLGESR
jgi:hypothetical protein